MPISQEKIDERGCLKGFHHRDLVSSWIYKNFNFHGVYSLIDLVNARRCPQHCRAISIVWLLVILDAYVLLSSSLPRGGC